MVFEKPKLSEIILSSGSFGFYFLCYGYLSLRYAFIKQPARSMSRSPRVTPGSDSVTGRRVPPSSSSASISVLSPLANALTPEMKARIRRLLK